MMNKTLHFRLRRVQSGKQHLRVMVSSTARGEEINGEDRFGQFLRKKKPPNERRLES